MCIAAGTPGRAAPWVAAAAAARHLTPPKPLSMYDTALRTAAAAAAASSSRAARTLQASHLTPAGGDGDGDGDG